MKNVVNNPMGIVVVGYGGMGGWHTKLLNQLNEFDLKGIYDIKDERSNVAEENGIKAYKSFEDVLSDKDVQLVTVAIPNDLHKDICIRAMKAGKNVVCEKPVSLNSDELQKMIDTSKECGVVFAVHQNRRWDHDYRTIKKIFDENTLGHVFNIESRVHGSRGIPGDWRNKKAHGGGMVLDWGVHLLDQTMQIAGSRKLLSVYAQFSYVSNEECEDGFKILLEFEDDLKFHVEVGTNNFINLPRWYMTGENGSAIINDWALNGKIVMVSDWENRDAVPVVTEAGLTKTMAPRTSETIKEYPLPEVSGDIKEYYRNIKATIEGREEQIVKNDEVMKVMRLMETVFLSAETNQVITDIDF